MITCKKYVEIKKKELINKIKDLKSTPTLAIIQVGDDLASNSYIKGKIKDCCEVGINALHLKFGYEEVEKSPSILYEKIESLNQSEDVDGVILQLPVPPSVNVKKVQSTISIAKDVDGFNLASPFTPCTPKGIMDYLKYNRIKLEGLVCTIIGRSEIVGKPLVNLLIDSGATVVSCNSKTTDIKHYTENSDIVFSAIGKANYFGADYFRNDKSQILIDIGINRDQNGKLCGDIQESVKEDAFLATSVPGGVGLLTRVALLENTLQAHTLKKC